MVPWYAQDDFIRQSRILQCHIDDIRALLHDRLTPEDHRVFDAMQRLLWEKQHEEAL